MRRLRDEEGSILPLTMFYGVLCLVLILLVVAATSLYLERKRLFTLADGAALAGAESFSLEEIATAGGLPQLSLNDVAVRSAAQDYLSHRAAQFSPGATQPFDALALVEAHSADGRSATVRLAATWHPPVVSLLVPDGIRLEVTSVARSVFW
ncbi:pilus assembly protein TadG-related protein [Rathayibacter soli]|uniref:pilus assembly protein TadG-related protein n=1 Tax=Rathayibacter soli TaxID=3144168 RepID=UPI0027E46770|nr:pilus assembly protein TadG-related protein [Glaciibacter superstes]